jgi:hypothetical protein
MEQLTGREAAARGFGGRERSGGDRWEEGRKRMTIYDVDGDAGR